MVFFIRHSPLESSHGTVLCLETSFKFLIPGTLRSDVSIKLGHNYII